jgi:dinuclear metal center YbgI/SA1388 family protein
MSVRISDIVNELEAWAPADSAQDYDNVGLQVGDPTRSVERVLVALDMTPQVLEEAVSTGCELIVTHHPLLFRPLKRLTTDTLESSMALGLAEQGIALFSIHTNLDVARDGVSFGLAGQLGLKNIEFLSGLTGMLNKLVVFVPETHAESVRAAMAAAGAGTIGAYRGCSFSSVGTGHFTPTERADPFTDSVSGREDSVAEIRLEVEVTRWQQGRVLEAMHTAHPYEEVAHDLIPVKQKYKDAGLGAIGDLDFPMTLSGFLDTTCRVLENRAIRFAGDLTQMVQRVAVCGGSGSEFVPEALSAGADVYLTADVSYHRFFDILDNKGTSRMALVDAGHYETERIAEELLVNFLRSRFEDLHFLRTTLRTSPVHTFVVPGADDSSHESQ